MQFTEEMKNFFAEESKRRKSVLVKKHEQLNAVAVKGQIVFAGSSLMEDFPITEIAMSLPNKPIIYNRGIGGDTLDGFSERLNSAVIDLMPKKLFINIGTNDFSADDYTPEGLISKYEAILNRIIKGVPGITIFVLSYYPVNRTLNYDTSWLGHRTNQEINIVNDMLKSMSEKLGAAYINVTDCLKDERGNLREELTVDGVHMLPDGYKIVLNELMNWIN